MDKPVWIKSLRGYPGLASVYNTPKGVVMVSRVNALDRGDETMIFRWDLKNDRVASRSELYAGHGETHDVALLNWLSE